MEGLIQKTSFASLVHLILRIWISDIKAAIYTVNFVLYALTLSDQTRIALYFLPIWFIVLGIFYRIKTKNSKQHQIQLAAFREKVIAQEAAAKAYRAKSTV